MTATLILLGIAYVLGALSVLLVEAAAVLILIRRLNRRVAQQEKKINESLSAELDSSSFYDKQVTYFSPSFTVSVRASSALCSIWFGRVAIRFELLMSDLTVILKVVGGPFFTVKE